MAALLTLASIGLTGCGDSTFTLGWPQADIHGEGKTMTADLTGIPSTGYMWTVEIENESVIKETGHTSEAATSDESEELVGTAQVEHYTFEVVGDGETLVTAKYARSWEETPDDLEYVFKVTVTNGKISAMSMEDDLLTESVLDMISPAN